MTFKDYYREAFVSPFVSRTQPELAINAGPDMQLASRDVLNTFPSKLSIVKIKLPKKNKSKKKTNQRS